MTAVGSISFGYDDSGNRVSKTVGGATTSYTYDPQNRLVAVDLPNDPDDVVFVYDADGRRVSRSHGDHSTVYVGGVFEIDRDGSTVTDTRTRYRFGDTMVATRTHSPASVVFLLQDHLGSTTAAFDDTSNTAMFQWYYPYGAERHAVGSLPTEQRYTGQTSDATGAASGDTGLLFYQARYYDPEVGAFVAADTIVPTTARSVGLNRYGYVAGNPVNYTDPTGHCWWVPGSGSSGCPGAGVARDAADAIGSGFSWAWDHKRELFVVAAAAACVAASAGVGAGGCAAAAKAAFIVQAIDVVEHAESFPDVAAGLAWSAVIAGSLGLPGGAVGVLAKLGTTGPGVALGVAVQEALIAGGILGGGLLDTPEKFRDAPGVFVEGLRDVLRQVREVYRQRADRRQQGTQPHPPTPLELSKHGRGGGLLLA